MSNSIPSNVVAFNSLGSSSSTQVIGEDNTRAEITFHNPNSVSIAICPALDSSGSTLSASFTGSALGGMYILYAGAEKTFRGTVGCAWNAIAQTGTTNGLTMYVKKGTGSTS